MTKKLNIKQHSGNTVPRVAMSYDSIKYPIKFPPCLTKLELIVPSSDPNAIVPWYQRPFSNDYLEYYLHGPHHEVEITVSQSSKSLKLRGTLSQLTGLSRLQLYSTLFVDWNVVPQQTNNIGKVTSNWSIRTYLKVLRRACHVAGHILNHVKEREIKQLVMCANWIQQCLSAYQTTALKR